MALFFRIYIVITLLSLSSCQSYSSQKYLYPTFTVAEVKVIMDGGKLALNKPVLVVGTYANESHNHNLTDELDNCLTIPRFSSDFYDTLIPKGTVKHTTLLGYFVFDEKEGTCHDCCPDGGGYEFIPNATIEWVLKNESYLVSKPVR